MRPVDTGCSCWYRTGRLSSVDCDLVSFSLFLLLLFFFSLSTSVVAHILRDIRNGPTPKVRYNEVHSDDVTELNFHPTNAHILLSGSTDGLVNVSDTRIEDEDEVVIQAFNHGASVHHAGFLNDTEVYALSHDEKLALYDLAETREAGSATRDFGDVRQAINCQYVANVLPKSGGQAGAVIGAGSQEYVHRLLPHFNLTYTDSIAPKCFSWCTSQRARIGRLRSIRSLGCQAHTALRLCAASVYLTSSRWFTRVVKMARFVHGGRQRSQCCKRVKGKKEGRKEKGYLCFYSTVKLSGFSSLHIYPFIHANANIF